MEYKEYNKMSKLFLLIDGGNDDGPNNQNRKNFKTIQ